jgi:hypothetical protein
MRDGRRKAFASHGVAVRAGGQEAVEQMAASGLI